MDSDWILADVHMRGYPVPDTEATVHWHQDGAFVIFPISPGRYRLLADMPPSGEAHPPTPTLEQVQTLIGRYANVLEAELRSPPDPQGIWLIRPDGYVAAVAKLDDLSPIENVLARLVT